MDNEQTSTEQAWMYDEEAKKMAVLEEKMTDAMTPGFEVEFSPEEADLAGAFVENAISEQDALESVIDLVSIKSNKEN